jgi:hypothetical protein
MSQKSGFFYDAMFAMFGMLSLYHRSGNTSKFQPPASTNGGGNVVIKSHGTPRIYGRLPRKRFYAELYDSRKREHYTNVRELAERGITWSPIGLFWTIGKIRPE